MRSNAERRMRVIKAEKNSQLELERQQRLYAKTMENVAEQNRAKGITEAVAIGDPAPDEGPAAMDEGDDEAKNKLEQSGDYMPLVLLDKKRRKQARGLRPLGAIGKRIPKHKMLKRKLIKPSPERMKKHGIGFRRK